MKAIKYIPIVVNLKKILQKTKFKEHTLNGFNLFTYSFKISQEKELHI